MLNNTSFANEQTNDSTINMSRINLNPHNSMNLSANRKTTISHKKERNRTEYNIKDIMVE